MAGYDDQSDIRNQDANQGNKPQQSYEYVFSSGAIAAGHKKPRHCERKSRFIFYAFMLLLCAVITLLLGFGGAMYANSLMDSDSEADFEETSDSTARDNLHYVRGIVDHGLELCDVTANHLSSYYYYPTINTAGVYVLSSAFNHDLQYKDRIVSVNGIEVQTSAELDAIVERYQIGETLTIVYEREDKTYTTELTLEEYVPDYIKEQSAS